ncbi:MAG: DUF2085 domain-containing protein [Blastocatellia bacterium]
MYHITLMVASVWILALFLPPWLMAGGQMVGGVIGYQMFSIICHQVPERSWQSQGFPLAVCSRCTAIYFGGLIGLLMYPLVVGFAARGADYAARTRRWLMLSTLPMLADVGLDWLGVIRNTFVTRTLTGLIVGVAAALHLYHLLVGAAAEWRLAGCQSTVSTGRLDRTGERNDDQ